MSFMDNQPAGLPDLNQPMLAEVSVNLTPEPIGGVVILRPPYYDQPFTVELDSGSAVSSVFGRIGAVTAQAGDYAAFYEPLGHAAGAPVTLNLISGDGSGGLIDSGIVPGRVVQKQTSYPTPATINQVIACLQAAGLCA